MPITKYATNTPFAAQYVYSSVAGQGTHTDLQAAIDAASSGDSVLMLNSYTGNITAKAGVNVVGFSAQSGFANQGTNVQIVGKVTLSYNGSVSFSGICFKTNADNAIYHTGSSTTIAIFKQCNFMLQTNVTCINSDCSGSNAYIYFQQCNFFIAGAVTTGIMVSRTGGTSGVMYFQNCIMDNQSASATSACVSNSCGRVWFRNSIWTQPWSLISNGMTATNCALFTQSNATFVTISTLGNIGVINSFISTGSASCVSIGSGCSFSPILTEFISTNTNAITGAGTVTPSAISFSSSSGCNVTTQNLTGTIWGPNYIGRSNNTAPAAGYIGEAISSRIADGSAISLTTATNANVTSISLTPGVWDVSCVGCFGGGAITGTQIVIGISATSATLGATGDGVVNSPTMPTINTFSCLAVTPYRVTFSATTTCYLVAQATFTVGTVTAFGRIQATRVA